MNNMRRNITVAYGSVPKDGGTFTFYRNLRPALLQHGVDLRCVSMGRQQALLWDDAYADGGCVLLEPNARQVKKQSRRFVRWCEEEGVDIAIAVNSKGILSAIDHLPESIRVLSRCANAFDHGYRITMSGSGRLAAIIATTPRLKSDLIRDYGAKPELVNLIPNGITKDPFEHAASLPRGTNSILQIGFLGRLEHNQKGVLHIPHIVRELNRRKVKFQLRIAGKGKHGVLLEREMEAEVSSGQVTLLGAINPSEVPEFLGASDIFLFTSHFEGCPNVLLEALMAGSVPVSWRIKGITDFIISDAQSGFLSDVGGYRLMGEQIEHLANDRQYLRLCSARAAKDARKRFDSRTSAAAYASVFFDVMSRSPPAWSPKPWSDFRVDENFSQSWIKRISLSLRRRIHSADSIADYSDFSR